MTRVNFDTSCNFDTFHWRVICPCNDSDRLINWSVANKFTTKSIACLSSVMILRISRRLSGASMLSASRRMPGGRSEYTCDRGKRSCEIIFHGLSKRQAIEIYIPFDPIEGTCRRCLYRFQSNRLLPTESSTHAFLLFVIAIVRSIHRALRSLSGSSHRFLIVRFDDFVWKFHSINDRMKPCND